MILRAVSLVITAAFLLGAGTSTVSGQAADQPLVLSGRVGSTIDAESRDYFGLFPHFEGFVTATAFDDGEEIVRIVVRSRDSDRVDTLRISREAANEIGRFIDHFEALRERTDQVRWHLMHPHVRPTRTPPRGGRVAVATREGSIVRGYILQATHLTLVLASDRSHPDRFIDPSETIVLPAPTIERISRGWWRDFVIDDLPIEIGGSFARFQAAGPLLKRLAGSQEALSPEVAAIRNQVVRDASLDVAARIDEEPPPPAPRRRAVQVGLSYAAHPESMLPTAAQQGYGGARTLAARPSARNLGISVEYAPVNPMTIGARLRFIDAQRLPEAPNANYFGYSLRYLREYAGSVVIGRSVIDLPVTVNLIRVEPEAAGITAFDRLRDAISLRVGAGPSVSRTTMKTLIATATEQSSNVYSAHVVGTTNRRWLIGGTATVELSLQPLDVLSLGLRGQVDHYLRAEYDRLEAIPPAPEEFGKSVTMTRSSMTFVSVGPHLRLHL